MLIADINSWSTIWLLTAYSCAVILASVLGGLLPEWIRLTHNRMQLMISFVGGVMLGIAVFHMIPHALVTLPTNAINQVSWGLMLGLLATFFLLRIFHFHQHGPADFGITADERRAELAEGLPPDEEESTHLCSDHNHPASTGSQAHAHDGCQGAEGRGATRWMAVLVGLGLHTLMDGVAMASGIAADVSHGHAAILPGLGIFLAVLLHKPLDAVSITSLMHPVTTPTKRLLVNVSFALMCPLGAFLFWSGASLNSDWAASLAGWGLAFSAGVFLCISLSDLLPEMEFHSHNRVPLSIALLLGIFAAWAIGLAEGEHAHQHAPTPATQSAVPDDHGHAH
ncbi:ZIP family metal transporter [Aureliella helgolandensis]|uniref:ZIP Zinc transporter n=1 Tax=Aureliella helgolandensis TaxID=2527968 RepID=A0A518G6E4_9BACT|nr:ZIP family metal transporter [Aureliella helgolandensis]QDV24162.1 ZIP Zinc transporter [Aureliella helgolandensis]